MHGTPRDCGCYITSGTSTSSAIRGGLQAWREQLARERTARAGSQGISPSLTRFGDLFSLAALAQHEGERDCLRSYSGHGVAEAKAEDTRLMRDERETALGLLLHAVNGPVVRPNHLHDSGV